MIYKNLWCSYDVGLKFKRPHFAVQHHIKVTEQSGQSVLIKDAPVSFSFSELRACAVRDKRKQPLVGR